MNRKTGSGERPSNQSGRAIPSLAAGGSRKAGHHCRLGPSCRLEGELESDEAIEIDGEFKGKLSAIGHSVTLNEGSRVEATIDASRVVIAGSIQGTVIGRAHTSLTKSARMVGKLATAEIRVDEGAVFRGQVDHLGSKSD